MNWTWPPPRSCASRPPTAPAEHRQVGVDLSVVTFCDCAGLSALLGATRIARSHGTDLHLQAVPARLAKLLRVSHTRGAFVIDDRQLDTQRGC
ncbi:STAS domain-containing protein [Streptomycetaceae bacterium NBC_01309]